MKRIYLDNNATTPLDRRVIWAMVEEFEKEPANPSSIHHFGREAKNRLHQARQTIAHFLQVKPNELFFFSSGSEALNTLLRTSPKGHILTSDIEHSAIYKTVQVLEKKGGSATYLSTGLWGAVRAEEVKKALRQDTQLIILSAVNSETGVKNPVEEIATIAKEASIPFIVDAVSLLGKEPFSIHEGIAGMVFSSHKLHGPKGVGLAWTHPKFKWEPLITGGDQELSKRAGTENLVGIIGFAKAIELLQQELPEATKRMEMLRNKFEQELQKRLSHVQVNGQGPRVVNTSNLFFHGIDGETLLMKLDLNGIAASHGSACSSGALEPSRVLRNMGLSREQASSSLRFSLSRLTNEEEINQAIDLIATLVQQF